MKKLQLLIILFLVSVKVETQNESKLVLAASGNQTSDRPLILLQNSIGGDLLWIHSDHYSNAFVGNQAGYSNMAFSGGTGNTFMGYGASRQNKTGSSNTAMGSGALYNNISGHFNTVSGFNALSQNSSGSYNTANGYFALAGTVASSYNTALGFNAGGSYDNGWNNVFLGANTDVSASGLFNVIAIGQGTIVNASSTARFGNEATTSYGGWANWTNVSDRRFKKNVKENVVGLDFLLRLQPVTYNLDISGLSKNQNGGREWDAQMELAIFEKEKVVQTGFIAQDVERAALEAGFNFSGIDAPKNEFDYYGLRYAEFVVPLVKAVQELNLEITNLKKLNDGLMIDVESLKANVDKRESKIDYQQFEIDLLKERLDKLEALILPTSMARL